MTQKDLDVVRPMYNLIKYTDNYSKTSGSLWQYYRDGPDLTVAGVVDNFPGNSTSFKFKQKITDQTGNDGTKYIEIMVLLKYLSNFWRTFEIPLINCEINHILNWSANYSIVAETANKQAPTFAITDTQLYVHAVTWSTQDNVKLFQQLKSGFKRTINLNKCQSKVSLEERNQYLDSQLDLNFQGVNIIFVLREIKTKL